MGAKKTHHESEAKNENLLSESKEAPSGEIRVSLSGRVVDATGAAVSEALVELMELVIKDHTTEDGAFCLEDIPCGNSTVRVVATGFKQLHQTIDLADDTKIHELLLKLKPH